MDVYYEGAVFGQVDMETLADRAVHAHGRLAERYPTAASGEIPRNALVAVGTFDPVSGRVILTGPLSERHVAGWIGVPRLDPAELRRSLR